MERNISESEFLIMRIIWDNFNTITSTKLIEKLKEQYPSWKRTTVSTFVVRLCKKGLIISKRSGREAYYIALLTEDEYHEHKTNAFVQKMYNGDAKSLVATLIKNDFLSAEDIIELNKYWNKMAEDKNE